MLIKAATEGSNKLLSSERIWARTAKCFLDQNGKQLNSKNLGVAYQKGQPQSKEILSEIIIRVKLTLPTE